MFSITHTNLLMQKLRPKIRKGKKRKAKGGVCVCVCLSVCLTKKLHWPKSLQCGNTSTPTFLCLRNYFLLCRCKFTLIQIIQIIQLFSISQYPKILIKFSSRPSPLFPVPVSSSPRASSSQIQERQSSLPSSFSFHLRQMTSRFFAFIHHHNIHLKILYLFYTYLFRRRRPLVGYLLLLNVNTFFEKNRFILNYKFLSNSEASITPLVSLAASLLL